MKVYIEKEKKDIEVSATTGKELLKTLGIKANTVLLVRDDEVILPEEKLFDSDSITILSVVSGG